MRDDNIGLIGRRSSPIAGLPPTGSVWTKPVDYEIRRENGAGFRWFMVSTDGNHYALAKSPELFDTEAECLGEINRLKSIL